MSWRRYAHDEAPIVSVVVPTITGREQSLARVLHAYRFKLRMAMELIVVEDQRNWPAACNIGANVARGRLLHFGADDLFPYPGWLSTHALAILMAGELPAPFVYDRRGPEGSLQLANRQDGRVGDQTAFTRVPLMTRRMCDAIGPWPEIDYMADCWLSARARKLGIETRMAAGYGFLHEWHPRGRLDSPERMALAQAAYEHELALLAPLPQRPFGSFAGDLNAITSEEEATV